jgi:apolipoprotein N-acyltransferase
LIGFDGKIKATLPRFKSAVLTGTVQPRTGLTPYARIGNWPVVTSLLGVLFVMIRRRLASRVGAVREPPSEVSSV